MKIDGSISLAISSSAAAARAAEQAGYDGAWTAETNHDPFLACVVGVHRCDAGHLVSRAKLRSPVVAS
jgi:alkanesulfonate monooxygenase SsuD/methylene tetrahydromethanopterin reductase-like flavin-dependent oxidoreductase (luciferase family)